MAHFARPIHRACTRARQQSCTRSLQKQRFIFFLTSYRPLLLLFISSLTVVPLFAYVALRITNTIIIPMGQTTNEIAVKMRRSKRRMRCNTMHYEHFNGSHCETFNGSILLCDSKLRW